MSDFFLELFSEEIPSNLQKSARNQLLQSFNDFFKKENIILKKQGKAYSTPNRLIITFPLILVSIVPKENIPLVLISSIPFQVAFITICI